MPFLRTLSRVVSITLAVQAVSACATFLSPAAPHTPAPAADAASSIDPGAGGCT